MCNNIKRSKLLGIAWSDRMIYILRSEMFSEWKKEYYRGLLYSKILYTTLKKLRKKLSMASGSSELSCQFSSASTCQKSDSSFIIIRGVWPVGGVASPLVHDPAGWHASRKLMESLWSGTNVKTSLPGTWILLIAQKQSQAIHFWMWRMIYTYYIEIFSVPNSIIIKPVFI